MPVAKIDNFSGMIPMKDEALLPDNASAYSENAYLYSGALQGFRKSGVVKTLENADTRSVYRIPLSSATKPDFIGSKWLEFNDEYMSVLRSQVSEDQFNRYYFFPSDQSPLSAGPTYNTLANILANAANLRLGVPTPEAAPTVGSGLGTPTAREVRSYVYTWQTLYGEEGAPSPPVTHTANADGTWTLRWPLPLTADTNDRNLAFTNVYRTVVDINGNASFYRIAHLPIATHIYADSALSTDIVGNLVLPSVTFTPPPADLQGVVAMANGILAGFSNKREVWFCEPYLPHAWPATYQLSVDAPIVGLAAVGSSLVVVTEGSPWIMSGVSPSTMTNGKIAAKEACISRGSIAPAGEGVYYASANGLILVNSLGSENVTQSFMTKENWLATGVYDFAASRYSLAYLAFSKNSRKRDNGIVIDHAAPNVSFSWLAVGPVINVYNDELSGGTFLVTGTQILEWNPEVASSNFPYIWKSREFQFPYTTDFVGGIVYFVVPPSVKIPVPTDATRNTSQNQDYDPTKQYLLLRVYADRRLVLVRELQVSGEALLFPSGYKATYWQFQLEGQVTVKTAKFATSTKELREL